MPLSNDPPPWDDPPEIETPRAFPSHGVSENDRRGSTIENRDTPATPKIQVGSCEHCGEIFQPRKGTGGKPQRFCSTECRKAFHANVLPDVPNVPPVNSNVSDVGKDGGKVADVGGDFDWSDDDNKNIVLHEQSATAIYFNGAGSLVIRQRCWPDDDQMVIVTKSSITEFLDRLTDACGVPTFP